jgi:hypothetical protein
MVRRALANQNRINGHELNNVTPVSIKIEAESDLEKVRIGVENYPLLWPAKGDICSFDGT